MRYVLDFRESPHGGAVVPGVLRLDGGRGDPLGALLVEQRIVFLLHGYNVNRRDGETKLLALARQLPHMPETGLVATLWPGDHWLGALSYPFEWRDARDSAAALVRFIDDNKLKREVPISFVTHSLGARVAMDAVRSVWQLGYRVDQICLMAPAIDDDSLADFRVYRRATEEARRVAVLSSVEDEVLSLAYPAGDLLHALFYPGESWDLALGYHGPRPEPEFGQPIPGNVHHVAIPAARGSDHGDYLPDKPPNQEQRSATHFAGMVVRGDDAPVYPPP